MASAQIRGGVRRREFQLSPALQRLMQGRHTALAPSSFSTASFPATGLPRSASAPSGIPLTNEAREQATDTTRTVAKAQTELNREAPTEELTSLRQQLRAASNRIHHLEESNAELLAETGTLTKLVASLRCRDVDHQNTIDALRHQIRVLQLQAPTQPAPISHETEEQPSTIPTPALKKKKKNKGVSFAACASETQPEETVEPVASESVPSPCRKGVSFAEFVEDEEEEKGGEEGWGMEDLAERMNEAISHAPCPENVPALREGIHTIVSAPSPPLPKPKRVGFSEIGTFSDSNEDNEEDHHGIVKREHSLYPTTPRRERRSPWSRSPFSTPLTSPSGSKVTLGFETIESVDEERLMSDGVYMFGFLRKFLQFHVDEELAMQLSAKDLAAQMEHITDLVHQRLDRFPMMKRHFLPVTPGMKAKEQKEREQEEKEQILLHRNKMTRFLEKFVQAKFDQPFLKHLDFLGKVHTPKAASPFLHVPLVHMNALLGYLTSVLFMTAGQTVSERPQRKNLLRALHKVLWILGDMFYRNYSPATFRRQLSASNLAVLCINESMASQQQPSSPKPPLHQDTANERRIFTDLHYRYDFLAHFYGFDSSDVKLIRNLGKALRPSIENITEWAFRRLAAFDCTRRHLAAPFEFGSVSQDADAGTPPVLGPLSREILERYLIRILSDEYDASMVEYLDYVWVDALNTILLAHSGALGPVRVPLIFLTALLGIVCDALIAAVHRVGIPPQNEIDTVRALGKLFWIQRDLLARHYFEKPVLKRN